MTARHACAIVAVGILLIWPAFLNGYPLLFSDTGSFMEQLLRPFMLWDKPWIYGPFLVVTSLKLTLWLPALAQGLLVSWVLWRVQAVFRTPAAAWHLTLCLLLALGSAAPWFASLLMPDILVPLTVLTIFLLAFDPSARWRWPVAALASFAIAAHLSHLFIATACLAVLMALHPRAIPRAAAPVGVAMALLVTTNFAGHGRLGLSPFGSVFGLARLVADGPAKVYLEANCPTIRYRICAWNGRLPGDADVFLWNSAGPVWTFPGGPIALAPEASRIVVGTILAQPGPVARAAIDDWFDQLMTLRLSKVIGDTGLDETVGAQLLAHYPAAEAARFRASQQHIGGLGAVAAPWQNVHIALLVLGTVWSSILLVRSWRRDPVLFGLLALIAVGLLSNAFVTGALSGPQDRYQARIVWLVLLPPALSAMRYLQGIRFDAGWFRRRHRGLPV